MVRKRPRRQCADCGHDISVHQFRPNDEFPFRGPQDCRLCVCATYRRPKPFERIHKLPVTKG